MRRLLGLLVGLLAATVVGAVSQYHLRHNPWRAWEYTFQEGQFEERPAVLNRTGGRGPYALEANTMAGALGWSRERAGVTIPTAMGGAKMRSGYYHYVSDEVGTEKANEWYEGTSREAQFTIDFWLKQPTFPGNEKRLIMGYGDWAPGQPFPECKVRSCVPTRNPPCDVDGQQYGGWALYSVGGDRVRFSARMEIVDVSKTNPFVPVCVGLEVTLLPGVLNHISIRTPQNNYFNTAPTGFLVMNSTGTGAYFRTTNLRWSPTAWGSWGYFTSGYLPNYHHVGLPTLSSTGQLVAWTGTLYSATANVAYLTDAQLLQNRAFGPPNSFPVAHVAGGPVIVNATSAVAATIPLSVGGTPLCTDFDDDPATFYLEVPLNGTTRFNGTLRTPGSRLSLGPSVAMVTQDPPLALQFTPDPAVHLPFTTLRIRTFCHDIGNVADVSLRGASQWIVLEIEPALPNLIANSTATAPVMAGAAPLAVALRSADLNGGNSGAVRIASLPAVGTLRATLANGSTVTLSVDDAVPATSLGLATVFFVAPPFSEGYNETLYPGSCAEASWTFVATSQGYESEPATVTTVVRCSLFATSATSTFLQGSSGITTMSGGDTFADGDTLLYVIERLPEAGSLRRFGSPTLEIAAGEVLTTGTRKVRFVYDPEALGDPYANFTFYVMQPATGARSRSATVILRVRAIGNTSAFTDRGFDSTLALYTFQDGMRSWPTPPPTLRDYTGRNLLGTVVANPGPLQWSRTEAGARVVSQAGGSRLRSGVATPLYALLGSEMTLELKFHLTHATTGFNAIWTTGTYGDVETPFDTTCQSQGWRFSFQQPVAHIPRRFYFEIATIVAGAPRCVILTIGATNNTAYHAFFRVRMGSVDVSLSASESVSFEDPTLRLDASRWAATPLHWVPLHSTTRAVFTGSISVAAIHDRYLEDDEVAAFRLIGNAPALSRFLGPATVAATENAPTLVATRNCTVEGSEMVVTGPSRGTLLANATHAVWTSAPYDLEPATVGVRCDFGGYEGPTTTVEITVAQGPPAPRATPLAINTFANVPASFNLTGSIVHGGALDSFTVLTLPDVGDLAFPNGTLLGVAPVTLPGNTLALTFVPPAFVPSSMDGMDLIFSTSFLFGATKGDVFSPVAAANLTVRNPLRANAFEVACVEDTPCAFSLEGSDETSPGVVFRVTSLPAVGVLFGEDGVTPVEVNEIVSGALVWEPPENAFGAALGTISFVAFNESAQAMSSGATATLNVAAVNDPWTFAAVGALPTLNRTTSRAASPTVSVELFDVEGGDEFDVSLSVTFPADFTMGAAMTLQQSLNVTRIEGFGIQSRRTRFVAPYALARTILGGGVKVWVPTAMSGSFVVMVRDTRTQRSVTVRVDFVATGADAEGYDAGEVEEVEGGGGIEMTEMDDGSGGGGSGSPLGFLTGTLLYGAIGVGVLVLGCIGWCLKSKLSGGGDEIDVE